MRIDAILGIGLAGVADAVRDAYAAGYDGVWASEVHHDPFLPLVLAAAHSDGIALGSRAANAFVRDPLTLATLADDLQLYSRGRFVLGLDGDGRAEQLRELILVIRAAWLAWETGEPLEFSGDFYEHAERRPAARGANPFGPPRVFVSGTTSGVAEVAGEVADGFVCPELLAPATFHALTLPALLRGLTRARRPLAELEIASSAPIATGLSDWELRHATAGVRRQLALLVAEPEHRQTLDHCGLTQLHEELNGLARRGRWAEMTDRIDDGVVQTFAVVGKPDAVGATLYERHPLDSIALDLPYDAEPDRARAVNDAIRAGWARAAARAPAARLSA